MRIQIAAVFSLVIIAISTTTVKCIQVLIITHGIYKTIDSIQDYDDYLAAFPEDSIFTEITIDGYTYIYLINQIRSILKWMIKLLLPIYPCLVLGYSLGSLVVFASILNLFYIFREYIIKLRKIPRNSLQLKWLWNFPPHSCLSFSGNRYDRSVCVW